MKAFIKWFKGFFEDQANSASSKRATLYIFCFFFYMQVKASVAGAAINTDVLYMTIFAILFCIGAITSEFFKDFKFKKNGGISE